MGAKQDNKNKKKNIKKVKKVKEEKKKKVEKEVEEEEKEVIKEEEEEIKKVEEKEEEIEEPPMKKVKEAEKPSGNKDDEENASSTSQSLGLALFNSTQSKDSENSAILELFGTESLKSQEPGFVPLTVEEVKAKQEEAEAKAKETKKAQEEERRRTLLEKDRSTIFIGNVPVTTKEKELKKIFKAYGPIESVRFRSVPLNPKGKEPLKVAFHRGAFAEGRDTMCAYIVYKDIKSAENAVKEANNTILGDKHLRVDSASGTPSYPPKKTVFIGNLPYDAKEEDLRTFFEECGSVEAVRIVRSKNAQKGTGIAFVQFGDRTSVTTAVLKNGATFMEREIRVSPCLDPKKSRGVLERQKREYEQAKKLKRRGVKGGVNPNAQKRGIAPVKSKKTTKPKIKKKRKH